MTYRAIKWTVFTALFLAAPALLFLVQVVFFIPAIFLLAGLLYVVPKAFVPAHTGESLAFMAFLAVHLLVHAALFYGISTVLAKVIAFAHRTLVRNLAVAAVCLGLAALTLMPVYGGGGHGPIRWTTLPEALSQMDRSYGRGTVWLVYGSTLLGIGAIVLVRHLRNWPAEPRPPR